MTMEESIVAVVPAPVELVHPDIDMLLSLLLYSRYQPLYPPHRLFDHCIHLYPNMKPVKFLPNRYPHYQKGEMENLVADMLKQGIIRFSHIPFPSLVLLVKKRMVLFSSVLTTRI